MEPSTSRCTRNFIALALRSQELCRWRLSSVGDILNSCMPHDDLDTAPPVVTQPDFRSENNADCILQECVDFIQRCVGSEQRQCLPLTPTVIHDEGFRIPIVGLKSPLVISPNAFTFLEGFVFVVSDNESDPFVDSATTTENKARRVGLDSTPKSLRLVGELLAYAGRVFATQYRHHLFTLVLFPRTARLIRWDRTQAFISASFDHRENSDVLASILRRFSRMSPFQRGTDPFVTEGEVSFEEVEILREALEQAPPEVRQHSGDECLGLMVLPGNEDLPLLLLASNTDATTIQAPFCHRGSISPPRYAYSTRTRSFVLLLDAFVRKGAASSDVYTILHQHDVPNVPTLLWQGEVPTDCCNNGLSVYRSAIESISGLRLESCQDARRLAGYFADICQTVETAGKHGIFHGRICPMDIRLHNGHACLINWPQALLPGDGRVAIEEPELVNYKSIRRLTAVDDTYASLEDDLESVLWVFVESVLQTFAIDPVRQLFHLFMMDLPAHIAQQKKAFLRGAFDNLTFPRDVQWLHDLLYELCEHRDISSHTFRRYSLDDVEEEDSPLFSDSEGSTLCAYDVALFDSESESEGPSKRKAEDIDGDDDDVHAEKRARWDYVWESAAVKTGVASPASTVYSPLSPEFLPVLEMSEPWDISI